MNENQTTYNSAKYWQLVCVALINCCNNLFMILMNFVTYVAVGGYAIPVVLVSTTLTGMRVFDGVIDPIIGFVMDRFNSRFGKFRPLLLLGHMIMLLTVFVLFFLGLGKGTVFFFIVYALYIVGYSINQTVAKAAIPCITNDPKQRPIIGRWTGIFTVLLSTFVSVYVSKVLFSKYGSLSIPAFQEMAATIMIVTTILVIPIVLALWNKDTKDYHGVFMKNQPITVKDSLNALKGNRPLQMLIIAAGTDKLAIQTSGNTSIIMLLFGIIIGNYQFQGTLALYALIPTLAMMFMGSFRAGKRGNKSALLQWTTIGIIVSLIMLVILVIMDPKSISVSAVPTVIFVVVYILLNAVKQVNSSFTNVMIADCSDYEIYRTGKNMPGMISTLFAFVDQLFSSFSNTIVGLVIATIGYTTTMPQATDPYSTALFWVTMFLWLGTPLLGWVASLIALKFYKLDAQKMVEVAAKVAEIRRQNAV